MPFVYYIPEQDTEAMQKPMDAERLLRCLGASGKLAGFPCAAYMVEQVREDPAHHQTALSGNSPEISHFSVLC